MAGRTRPREASGGRAMANPKVTGRAGTRGDRVVDDTAPGEGPVTISSTEARASEPVLASEGALEKDVPPPASTPRPTTHDGTRDVEAERRAADGAAPTSGDGDYVGRREAATTEPGEPEWNADARTPAPGETTYDGRTYEEVADPRDPMERLEKRELELGADMDYGEHRRTYSMFIEGAKWGTMVVIALLVAMAVGFFMAGGFIGGIVVFFGAVLAGFVFMR